MEKLRLAIIGFGGMGSWHAENISKKIPEIEVCGAYDIRPEALENAREKLREVMQERKVQEALKEKAFEEFLMEEKQQELDKLSNYEEYISGLKRTEAESKKKVLMLCEEIRQELIKYNYLYILLEINNKK